MAKSKPTKYKTICKHLPLLTILAAALLISGAILGWAEYRATPHEKPATLTPKSTPAHVDGDDAVNNVTVFYNAYIKLASKPDIQKKVVEVTASKNLLFYKQYYQHGFDPITCSTVMPNKVTASLVSTGPVATVNANLEYPDNTKATVVAKVVLNDEGLQIDSLTCSGEKGNLPPERAQ